MHNNYQSWNVTTKGSTQVAAHPMVAPIINLHPKK